MCDYTKTARLVAMILTQKNAIDTILRKYFKKFTQEIKTYVVVIIIKELRKVMGL